METANLAFLQHEDKFYDQLYIILRKHIPACLGLIDLNLPHYCDGVISSTSCFLAGPDDPCLSASTISIKHSPLTRSLRPLPDCIGYTFHTATQSHATYYAMQSVGISWLQISKGHGFAAANFLAQLARMSKVGRGSAGYGRDKTKTIYKRAAVRRGERFEVF
jgi:hypothetical protein